jgi:hypothetical protein
MTLEPQWLRQQLVVALAADDDLFDWLTLKGGIALALAHKIGNRSSLDIDYSLRSDIGRDTLEPLILAALRRRLDQQNLHIFDFCFLLRPPSPTEPRWGGYRIEFKIIAKADYDPKNVQTSRRRSLRIGSDAQDSQKWTIEISRHEVIPESEELTIAEGFTCRVYTKSMIGAEKLRALCQQMPEYPHRAHPTPRPRDYYDIHSLITEGGVNIATPHFANLLVPVFEAKEVPLSLLQRLSDHSNFHASDWDSVANSIPANRPRIFSFYEQFVLDRLQLLYKVLGW